MPKHYAMNHLILEPKMRILGVKAKKCLDCETPLTAILEKCADTVVLHKPRTKD